MTALRVLDLFSGIGGFSLGLERAGMRTQAFCEIDPFAQCVLHKHWPHTPIYPDVSALTGEQLHQDGLQIDVICGGFPCQDISIAGRQAGLDGERSGLWVHLVRLIKEVQPRYAIIENVRALLSGPGRTGVWFRKFLSALASIGYDAEWFCIPASALGADHQRNRVWIVTYPCEERLPGRGVAGIHPPPVSPAGPRLRVESAICATHALSRDYWSYEPILGGRLHGVPNRVDRIKALGNAVVPQVAEALGRAILAYEEARE